MPFVLIWRKWPRARGWVGVADGAGVGGAAGVGSGAGFVGGVEGGVGGIGVGGQAEHRHTPKTYCDVLVRPLQRECTHFWQLLHLYDMVLQVTLVLHTPQG